MRSCMAKHSRRACESNRKRINTHHFTTNDHTAQWSVHINTIQHTWTWIIVTRLALIQNHFTSMRTNIKKFTSMLRSQYALGAHQYTSTHQCSPLIVNLDDLFDASFFQQPWTTHNTKTTKAHDNNTHAHTDLTFQSWIVISFYGCSYRYACVRVCVCACVRVCVCACVRVCVRVWG